MSEFVQSIGAGINFVSQSVDRYVLNGHTRNRFVNALPGESNLAMATKQIVMAPLAFAIPEPLKVGEFFGDSNKTLTGSAYIVAASVNMNTEMKWGVVGAQIAPIVAEKLMPLLHLDPHLIAPAAIAIVGALAMGTAARAILNVQQNTADAMFYHEGGGDSLNDMYHASAIGGTSGGQAWITPNLAESVGNAIVNALP